MNSIELARTRPALPSKLGVFMACPARYLLESEPHTIQQVPVHPRTVLGSAVHRLAYILQKDKEIKSASVIELLEKSFISELDNNRRSGLITQWALQHHGVAGLISRHTLLEQVRYAISLTVPVAERENFLSDSPKKRQSYIPVGREQLLTSFQFNMSGRADLIYQIDSRTLRVVDYKTGKVTDDLNQPKDHYLLQIAAYGMMLKELAPDIDIELELTGISDRWIGGLDFNLNNRVAHILSSMDNTLPLNEPMHISALAQTGQHCITCISRCSCPVYQKKLELYLQRRLFDLNNFGYDMVGRLISVEEENELITLRVKLDNGFAIKIFRIPTRFFPESERVIGRYLSIYGANRLGESVAGRFHRNFYVIDTQDPKRSAFQFFLQWK
ncbi:PD-(D/E)XK nuclease family protein [Erwinia sp. AnSW2-5]|uniref:PD-(D/E)XK nuclease family protein n=1 Tax=Erwinia sp. AnSW2-5 TaxID=3367692 RepID=UPI003858D4F0